MIAVLGLSILSACTSEQSEPVNEGDPFLESYFEAFSNQDVEFLLEMSADNIRMMSITPETMFTDLHGKQNLRNWLEGYFRTFANVRSSYAQLSVREPFFTFVETANWGPDTTRKQQSSMATFQIKEDKIQRVWYFYPGE